MTNSTSTPSNETSLMGIRVFRPSHPAIAQLTQDRFVVTVTGHRMDKLGGYSSELRALEGSTPITAFRGTFGFLSNFSACTVQLDGKSYRSVEAAFQAAKTFNQKEREAIRRAKTPGEAKTLGQRVQLRPDWEAVKVKVMEGFLRQKFSKLDVQYKLLATLGRDLQEGNRHGDTFWGLVDGAGENRLGHLLMKLRQEFFAARRFEVHDPEVVLDAVAYRHVAALKAEHGDRLLVVTGMALGWDQAIANACKMLDVEFIAALPFPKQASLWPEASQKRWAGLLRFSRMIVAVGSDTLADADIRSAMQWRNEFMVDLADLVLALWDGTPGGTANCVRDADAQGKTLKNVHADWQRTLYGHGLQIGKRVATPHGAGKVLDVYEDDRIVVTLDHNPITPLVDGLTPPPWVFPVQQVQFMA